MARRQLPPLNALRAFEAFGRLGRMNAAAEELCVTHGAVSRQIRQLERWLGYPLTEGPKTALKLTPQAERLLGATTSALDLIEAAIPKRPTADAQDLRLVCYSTFAIRWLIPRLPDFVARHPEVRLQVHEAAWTVDFTCDPYDATIQITRSETSTAGLEVTPLMANAYGPVASPGKWRTEEEPEAVLRLRGLHTRSWPQGWAEWARHAGRPAPDDGAQQGFAHFSHMLEAAVAGLGVAISPWIFVADDVLAGRLVAPLGFLSLPGHVVFARPMARRTAAGDAFKAWLLDQSGRMPPAPQMPRA